MKKRNNESFLSHSTGDASKVTANGPGIERTGNVANKKTHFEVFTKGMLFWCFVEFEKKKWFLVS